MDPQPARQRLRGSAAARHPSRPVGARSAAQPGRDLRDAARSRDDRRSRRRGHPRGGHVYACRRATRRIRHAGNDVGAGGAAEGGRGRGPQGPAARRRRPARRQPGRDHRDRPDRQPGRCHRGQEAGGQAAQRRRPAGADGGRSRRARSARHRALRRDDRAGGRRRTAGIPGAGVRLEQARPDRRPAVCADGFAGSAVSLRGRRGAHAEQARRQRLGQHQDQGPPGGARDRGRTGRALRQTAGLAGARIRPGHPVAARDGGRVRLHRDRRSAHRDHRGQVRHGEAGSDGPGDLR